MTEHKHAWFFRALTDGEPLENFEAKHACSSSYKAAISYTFRITTRPGQWEIRRKPRMVKIGDVEVKAGITEAPERRTWIWIADPAMSGFAFACRWDGDLSDTQRLQRGLIHLTKENAVAMGKALAALTEMK